MKNYFLNCMAVLLFAAMATNCSNCRGKNNNNNDAPTDGAHKGTFTNRNNQLTNDLHIVFDQEGVTYEGGESRTKMTSHTPVSANGKTQIDLDGDINPNSGAFGQVFKRAAGEFSIERYWWTIKEGGQSVKIGEDHIGPPNKDDGSGDWK